MELKKILDAGGPGQQRNGLPEKNRGITEELHPARTIPEKSRAGRTGHGHQHRYR